MLISSDSLKTLLGGNKRNNNRPIKNKKSEAITEALIQKIINDELGEQGSIQLYVIIYNLCHVFYYTYLLFLYYRDKSFNGTLLSKTTTNNKSTSQLFSQTTLGIIIKPSSINKVIKNKDGSDFFIPAKYHIYKEEFVYIEKSFNKLREIIQHSEMTLREHFKVIHYNMLIFFVYNFVYMTYLLYSCLEVTSASRQPSHWSDYYPSNLKILLYMQSYTNLDRLSQIIRVVKILIQ